MTNKSSARKEISRTLIITSSSIPFTNFFFSGKLKILKIFSAILFNCLTSFFTPVKFHFEVQFIARELQKTIFKAFIERGSDATCFHFRSIPALVKGKMKNRQNQLSSRIKLSRYCTHEDVQNSKVQIY